MLASVNFCANSSLSGDGCNVITVLIKTTSLVIVILITVFIHNINYTKSLLFRDIRVSHALKSKSCFNCAVAYCADMTSGFAVGDTTNVIC